MCHASSSLINHIGALSVQYASYQLHARGGGPAAEGGIFIFFSRGHLSLRAAENDVV